MMNALTALRACAALWVVLYHFDNAPLQSLGLGAWLPALRRGYLGVDLFFILSGFVIAHAHLGDFRVPTVAGARRFYALRLARFYPLHLAVLLGLLAVVQAGRSVGIEPGKPEAFTAPTFVENLLLVQAWWTTKPAWNYPAWSVSCEWFVYLLFPALAYAAHGLRSARAAGLALACAVLALGLAYAVVFDHDVNVVDRAHAPGTALCRVVLEFAAGGLLRHWLGFAEGRRLPWSGLALAGLGLGLAMPGPWADFALILAFLALIAAGSDDGSLVGRGLSRPVLVYLGGISYALYMVHAPVQMIGGRFVARLLDAHPGSAPFAAAVGLGLVLLTVALAAAAHHLIEAPARNWLRARLAAAPPVPALP